MSCTSYAMPSMQYTTFDPPPDADKMTPLELVILLYPGTTSMDWIGPNSIIGMFANTRLCWKTCELVPSDTGILIAPNTTFDEIPEHIDILMVPGGPGTADMVEDPEVLEFLRTCAARADFITSVCTGSIVLAAAGLMTGYKATTHWASHDCLAGFGAIPVKERVVVDRNRVTGAGVTAGLDFGLTLLAQIIGVEAAAAAQLAMEYDPAPPFNFGSPDQAPPEAATVVAGGVMRFNDRLYKAAAK